jgi:hypothetical protein
MNDGHDALAAVRTYACRKSQLARDKWLAFRDSQGMPVRQMVEKHAEPPGVFMRQFAKMRDTVNFGPYLEDVDRATAAEYLRKALSGRK